MDTGDLQDSRGKEGTIYFFKLYHFHPLTNIQTFNLQLCMWDDFNHHRFYLLDCCSMTLTPYWITIWSIDDVMLIFVCLLVDLI